MYSITHIHKGGSSELPIYIPLDPDYCLTRASCELEIGKAGSLTLGIPQSNPAAEEIVCLTDEIILYRDNTEIFRGRAITSQNDFELTGTLTVEGVLSYLYDTYYTPFEFQGVPEDLLAAVVANHNSFVSAEKQFTVGNITVTDRNDYINRSSTSYLRTIDILADKFVGSSLGGYFRVRVSNGTKYLDYLSSYNTTATQEVKFGENILDLASEIEYGDSITAVLPLGAEDEETGERLTVASVNGGDIYVRDANLISTHGFIAECVEWDDVTVAANLLTKSQLYLAQASTFIATFTIRAIDLSFADITIPPLKIGDSVHVYSPAHGVNQWSELSRLTLDILDPKNDRYEFGLSRSSTSLTGRTAQTNRNIRDSVSSLTVNFHKIAADYITAEYLSANYVAAQDLEADVARLGFATVSELNAETARIDTALIGKANVSDLTAANANITNLQADYANVATLLNGNAGIGTLQNIHLTSQNAVIDSAVINTILANNAIVNQLISGKIITDDVEVASADGAISLKGSTQTFKDGEGNVRLQLGQDALGNFTFVLYDETGSGVLIDSTGIKESAIGDGLINDSKIASNARIQASKLDIQSLFSEVNGSSLTFNSSRIWFDEGNQSANQVFSQVQSNTTQIGQNTAAVAEASSKAMAAQAAADQALDAISGITTLNGFVVTLSNDAHVVHTFNDGTGGDYTEAYTVVKAYLGDTDVSDHTTFTALPSTSVQGTWNANTRTYQVTGLTDEDGYVDFQCAYGHDHVYLQTRSGANLQTRSGNNLTLRSGSATITKRFSISKAPDGKIGTSYKIQSSAEILRKDTTGFIPPSITFTAMYNDGVDMMDYTGRYKIEESTDGSSYTQTYISSEAEEEKVYTPTSTNVVAIRCTLYSADNSQKLDMKTVTALIDAQGILEDFSEVQAVVQQTTETVTTYTQAVDRLEVQFEDLEETVQGYSDGRLLYQTPSEDNGDGTVTVRARVYKDGEEATNEFPARWFTWKLRTETGTVTAPNGYWGYSTIVPKSLMGFNGVVVCRFKTFTEKYLQTRSGAYLCTRNGNRLVSYVEN